MPTFERALVIQRHMGRGDIYWDSTHRCYRVVQSDSRSCLRKDHQQLTSPMWDQPRNPA